MFKATGRTSWGLGPGRADGIAEIERRAAERGLPPLRWPEPWPGNSLMTMRAAVFGGTPFAREAFRVHFVDGRTLDDPASLALAAERPGSIRTRSFGRHAIRRSRTRCAPTPTARSRSAPSASRPSW